MGKLVLVLLMLGVSSSLAGYDSFGLSNALEELATDGSVLSRNARQQKAHDDRRHGGALYCHTCSSSKHGDPCSHLAPNSTLFSSPCSGNQTVCMVKRFSVTENTTSPSILWSIERNCSSKCEPGCLILGERTKIHVCISCCTESSCNTGNGSASLFSASHWTQLTLFACLVAKWLNHQSVLVTNRFYSM